MQSIRCDTGDGLIEICFGNVAKYGLKVIPNKTIVLANRIVDVESGHENTKALIGNVKTETEIEIIARGNRQTAEYVLYNWPKLPPGNYDVMIAYNGATPGSLGFINIYYIRKCA